MVSAKTAAIGSAAILALGLGAGWIATQANKASKDPFAQCRQGVVSGSGSLGGAFTLVNGDGQTVTDRDVFTKPSLLYFGYTYCPDVCPLDSARNAQATDLLEERGYDVQPVFISVDAGRDTPETVKEFSILMHPKMIGLTGTKKQIDVASKAYRTYYNVQDTGDEYYLVDHSTQTYLVFPEAGYVDFFGRNVSPEEMADRVACFIDAQG